mgnify:CR=1 FL=1
MYDSWQACVHIILLAEHFIKLVLECFTDYRNKKLTKIDGVEIDTIEIWDVVEVQISKVMYRKAPFMN